MFNDEDKYQNIFTNYVKPAYLAKNYIRAYVGKKLVLPTFHEGKLNMKHIVAFSCLQSVTILYYYVIIISYYARPTFRCNNKNFII